MFSCPLNKFAQASQNFPAEEKQTLCELCRMFYAKSWLNPAGGGISIRDANKIYFGPVGIESNVPCPMESYVIEVDGKIKEVQEAGVKVFEHRSLMFLPHLLLQAGAVIHSHSMNSMLITWLFDKTFHFCDQEVLKTFHQSVAIQAVEIPIIENCPDESALAESFSAEIKKNSELDALLVRGHGFYVWGRDWMEAKERAEFYEFLFDISVRLKQQEFSGSGGPVCETK